MSRDFCACAVAALALACAPATLSERDRAAIREVEQIFRESVFTQEWAALEAVYADSAIVLPSEGAPVQGRENIQVWFSGRGFRVTTFETTTHQLEGRGDLAYRWGTYLFTFQAPGARDLVTQTGKLVWVLRRERDGTWRVIVDLWNRDQP